MLAVIKLPNLWSHNTYLTFVEFCSSHITIERKEKRELILLIEYLVMERLLGGAISETDELTVGAGVLKRLRDAIHDSGADLLLSMECDTDCERVTDHDYVLTSDILKTEGKFLDMDHWAEMLSKYLANVDIEKYEAIDKRIETIREWYGVEDVNVSTSFEITLDGFEWTGQVLGKCKHRIEVEI